MDRFDSAQEADAFLASFIIGNKDDVQANIRRMRPWLKPQQSRQAILVSVEQKYYKLINIPDVYSKRSTFELHESTAGPIKLPFGYEVGEGRFTINWMVESFAKKIPFEFAKWEDTVEVANVLKEYISYLELDLKELSPMANTEEAKLAVEEAEMFWHMASNFEMYLSKLAERLKSYYTVETREDRRHRMKLDTLRSTIGNNKATAKPSTVDDIKILKHSLAILRRDRSRK